MWVNVVFITTTTNDWSCGIWKQTHWQNTCSVFLRQFIFLPESSMKSGCLNSCKRYMWPMKVSDGIYEKGKKNANTLCKQSTKVPAQMFQKPCMLIDWVPVALLWWAVPKETPVVYLVNSIGTCQIHELKLCFTFTWRQGWCDLTKGQFPERSVLTHIF